MDKPVRVRFAPSPTGYIHIGNVRTALFNWMFARKLGGTFILRIEDTDRVRSDEQYTQQIVDDLRWLGLEWDEGPDVGGPFGPYKQSERLDIYRQYCHKLIDKGKAYRCYCTPTQLRRKKELAIGRGQTWKYDGLCRNLTGEQTKRFDDAGKPFSVRLHLPQKMVAIDDVIRGRCVFDSALLGDFVIMKSDFTPTFHFGVVVDDALMEISHVIRGEGHLPNTAGHILLFEALGFEPPRYAHMSLTQVKTGEVMSKRRGTFSIANYRELGYLPEALVNYLALLGWSPRRKKETFTIDEVLDDFRLEDLSRAPGVFDQDKLDFIAGYHIRRANSARIAKIVKAFLVRAGFVSRDFSEEEWLENLIGAFKDNISHVSQVVGLSRFVFEEPEIKDENAKLMKSEIARTVLKEVLKKMQRIDRLSVESFRGLTKKVQKETGIRGKELFMPIRVALTGGTGGPELAAVLQVLGREKCTRRLQKALDV